MTRRRTALPLVLAAVLAAACGGSSEVTAPDGETAPPGASSPADATSPARPTSPSLASPSPAAASEGEGNLAALDFVAPDLDGGQVRGADYAGQDVVLWMWAPW